MRYLFFEGGIFPVSDLLFWLLRRLLFLIASFLRFLFVVFTIYAYLDL